MVSQSFKSILPAVTRAIRKRKEIECQRRLVKALESNPAAGS